MIWKNLKERHAIIVRAFCIDDEGNNILLWKETLTFK